ncbi:MAG: hypothetical protein CO090_08845 [Acidobacteria bacterium CG_4_9_14_3_um_filter_49_7]|nr:MAG: hypothetical protein CO090_08845 [Acidobacteria bacterium CG_4_9_14_3_um_filter_49_7]
MKNFAILLIFFTAFPATADSLNLSLNLKKGNHFITTLTSTQAVIRDVGGQQTQVDNSTEMTLSFEVTGSDEKTYTITMRYTHIIVSSRGAGWEFHYDSTPSTDSGSTDSKQMNIFYKSLLNQPITLVIDRLSGTIKSMSGWDKLGKHVVEELRQGTATDRQKLTDMLISSIKNGIVNGGATSVFPSLAGRTIQKGSQWQIQDTLPTFSGLALRTTYKVTDLFPDRVTLSVSSSLSTSPTATVIATGATKTQYKLSGTQKGTLVVDRKTGWVTQTHVNQELEGTFTMIDMGLTIPVTVSGKTDIQSRQYTGSTGK